MLRIARLSAVAVAITAIWVYFLRSDFPHSQHTLVLLAPLIALFSLAAYLLFTLAYGVLNFKDCPEDAEALRKEVIEAKEDLRAKKVLD